MSSEYAMLISCSYLWFVEFFNDHHCPFLPPQPTQITPTYLGEWWDMANHVKIADNWAKNLPQPCLAESFEICIGIAHSYSLIKRTCWLSSIRSSIMFDIALSGAVLGAGFRAVKETDMGTWFLLHASASLLKSNLLFAAWCFGKSVVLTASKGLRRHNSREESQMLSWGLSIQSSKVLFLYSVTKKRLRFHVTPFRWGYSAPAKSTNKQVEFNYKLGDFCLGNGSGTLALLSRPARPCWSWAAGLNKPVCLVAMAVRWGRRPRSMLDAGRSSKSGWWIHAAEIIRDIRGRTLPFFSGQSLFLTQSSWKWLHCPEPGWMTELQAQTQGWGHFPWQLALILNHKGPGFAPTLLSSGHPVSLEWFEAAPGWPLDLENVPDRKGLITMWRSASSLPNSWCQQVSALPARTSAILKVHKTPNLPHCTHPFLLVNQSQTSTFKKSSY